MFVDFLGHEPEDCVLDFGFVFEGDVEAVVFVLGDLEVSELGGGLQTCFYEQKAVGILVIGLWGLGYAFWEQDLGGGNWSRRKYGLERSSN